METCHLSSSGGTGERGATREELITEQQFGTVILHKANGRGRTQSLKGGRENLMTLYHETAPSKASIDINQAHEEEKLIQ